MKKISLIILLGFILSACNLNLKNQEKNTNTVNSGNTNIEKTNTGNVSIDKNQNNGENKEKLKGNGIKFIGFVSTWCPHCQEAVPVLEKFYTKYSGDVNMEINVLNKKAFPGVKNLPENYKNPKSYKDYTNEACGYIPSYVLVNKDGKVIEKKCGGSLDENQLKDKLLSKQGEQTKNLNSNKQNKMTDNRVVKVGDTISVDYIGTFTDGKVFDTSIKDEAEKAGVYNKARTYEPLSFTAGVGQMIPCFDKAVIGMKIGETKDIVCQPKEAYGECDPKKVQKVEKAKLKAFEDQGIKLEKGSELPTQYGMLKIIDTDDKTVTLDMNSPMCGKVLNFKLTLKSIK